MVAIPLFEGHVMGGGHLRLRIYYAPEWMVFTLGVVAHVYVDDRPVSGVVVQESYILTLVYDLQHARRQDRLTGQQRFSQQRYNNRIVLPGSRESCRSDLALPDPNLEIRSSGYIMSDVSYHFIDMMTGFGEISPCLELELSEPTTVHRRPIVLLYREIRLSGNALV